MKISDSLRAYDRAKKDALAGKGKRLSPLIFKYEIDNIVLAFRGLDIPTTISHAIGGGYAVESNDKYIILPLID